jgi:hypothetical protein
MAVTTSTSVAEIVPTEVISDIIMAKQIDAMVAAPLAFNVRLPVGSGATFAFPKLDKDVGEDLATEETSATANELTFSETTCTVAVVALARENAKKQLRTNRLGPDGMLALQVNDAAENLAEMLDDDVVALFTSITDSIGTSGQNATLANLAAMVATQRANMARGSLAFVLDTQQANDITAEMLSTASSLFSGGQNQSLMNSRVDGYLGDFIGAPVLYTGLCDTANGDADVVGACIVRGDTNPERASIGVVRLWDVEMDEEVNAKKLTTTKVWNACQGAALIGDEYSVKLVTDA